MSVPPPPFPPPAPAPPPSPGSASLGCEEKGALPAADAARAKAAMENAVELVKSITDEVNEMQRLAERRSGAKLMDLARRLRPRLSRRPLQCRRSRGFHRCGSCSREG